MYERLTKEIIKRYRRSKGNRVRNIDVFNNYSTIKRVLNISSFTFDIEGYDIEVGFLSSLYFFIRTKSGHQIPVAFEYEPNVRLLNVYNARTNKIEDMGNSLLPHVGRFKADSLYADIKSILDILHTLVLNNFHNVSVITGVETIISYAISDKTCLRERYTGNGNFYYSKRYKDYVKGFTVSILTFRLSFTDKVFTKDVVHIFKDNIEEFEKAAKLLRGSTNNSFDSKLYSNYTFNLRIKVNEDIELFNSAYASMFKTYDF